jgi:hypothetical protein
MLNISVSDGVQGHQSSVLADISLLDADDNLPVITAVSGSVAEWNSRTQGPGALPEADLGESEPGEAGETARDSEFGPDFVFVVTVPVSDADQSAAHAAYQLAVVGEWSDLFRITNEGALYVNDSRLDRESVPSYEVTIRATADNCFASEVNQTVTVTVEDVNDNLPVFSLEAYEFTVPEELPIGSSTGHSVLALDADSGANGQVTYEVIEGAQLISVGSTTGTLSVAGRLDREQAATQRVTVRAQDAGGLFSLVNVTLILEDRNDNRPQLDTVRPVVLESVATGSLVATLSAVDADEGSNAAVDFFVVDGDLGHFAIPDPATGELRVSAPLDREAVPQYSLTIRAQDRGSPSLATVATVSIDILDVNDNDPIFSQSTYSVTVDEREDTVALLRVAATDADINESPLLYNMSEPGFAIDPVSGVLRTTVPLDRETKDSYAFMVSVVDSGSPARMVHTSVEVSVSDINDNTPVVESVSPASPVIAEDAGEGELVFTVTGSDRDLGENAALVYSIVAGNTDGAFSIDAVSGEVRTTAAGLDRETIASYTLTIGVRDEGTPSLSTSVEVTVQVGDVNDNSPSFTQPGYTAEIREDAAIGAQLEVVIAASDRDIGSNADLLFSLSGAGAADFEIDPSTAIVSVARDLDREAVAAYTLTITVRDGGIPSLATVVLLNITVGDVNDNDPVVTLIDPPSPFVSEDSGEGIVVFRVTATDQDSGRNAALIYSLVDGNVNGEFAIVDSAVGVITTTAVGFDRETIPEYALTVAVSDLGNPSRSINTSVTIILVGDVNDNSPIFSADPYFTAVSEGRPIGSALDASIRASDEDTGSNAVISYTLSGTGAGLFAIDSSNASLTLAAELDRETVSQYNLTVTATDGGSPARFTTASLHIAVLDINDNAPVVESVSPASPVIAEDAGEGELVFTVTGSDRDLGENAALVYSIVAGNTDGAFSIDAVSGEVRTTAAGLDRETIASYTLTIGVRDEGTPSLSTSVEVTVQVGDVNDNSPSFSQSAFEVNVGENNIIGSSIGVFTANDRDSGSNAQLLYEILQGNEGGLFRIDESTGNITLREVLDREVRDNYFLVLRAVDQGNPSLTGVANLSLSVTDENDNAPIFSNTVVEFSFSEAIPKGTTLFTLQSTDADIGTNAVVVYSILGGNTEDVIEIVNPTGTVQLKNTLDRERTSDYTFVFQVQDAGQPSLSTSLTISLIVEDENDNAPVMGQQQYSVTVNENEDATIVTSSSDADAGANAVPTYSLTGTTFFAVNASTGVISNTQTLDFEDEPSHNFVITVTDIGGRQDTAAVEVILQDVNDETPVLVGLDDVRIFLEGSIETPVAPAVVIEDADDNARFRMASAEVQVVSDLCPCAEDSNPFSGSYEPIVGGSLQDGAELLRDGSVRLDGVGIR